jgi:Zn-finger in Ran binding protein and others.
MNMTDSSSPEVFLTGAAMDNTNDCDEEWSCNSCTFSNSSAVSRCEMCNTLKPQSLSGWELESKGSVIDLTNMNNDDGPRANHNHLSFKKINSNHTWTVASTESARKRRKRKISSNDSASRSGHHGTTTGNLKDVIEINDTDDEQNILVSSRLVGKKNTSLRRSMETGHVKSRYDDNQVEGSRVYSGRVTDGLKIDDDGNLSELDESSFLSSSSSSFPRNKSKMQSTLFGSVVPDMKKKRHSESSTE